MLRLETMSCGYGAHKAVNELSLEITKGKIFSLIGANGAGKTSSIMAIAGHVQVQGGRIMFEGKDISSLNPRQRVELGIALVPEGRRLFSDMTVDENLSLGGYSRPAGRLAENRAKVLDLFPRLGERINQLTGSLSGGEQQMVALGRALMAEPKLLLIDELSLGLMPKVIDLCYNAILKLKEEGITTLLVEQNTTRALEVADSVCVLESGEAVWQGSAEAAQKDPTLIEAYLGMTEDK